MKAFASLASVLASTVILAASAGAASAQEARIAWGDLDLSTAAGATAFEARVDAAARKMCRDAVRPGSRISDAAYCAAAVREEAVSRLPETAQVEYARGRKPLEI